MGSVNLSLNSYTIDAVKKEAFHLVTELLQNDLVEAILYGSCARGDYTEDSDGKVLNSEI